MHITLAGAPQDEDLTGKKLQPVDSRLAVVAYAQAKTTNPESAAEVIGTLGDLLGPVLALLGNDKLSASVGVITKSFYRATWWGSDAYPLTVHDWEGGRHIKAKHNQSRKK